LYFNILETLTLLVYITYTAEYMEHSEHAMGFGDLRFSTRQIRSNTNCWYSFYTSSIVDGCLKSQFFKQKFFKQKFFKQIFFIFSLDSVGIFYERVKKMNQMTEVKKN